MAGGIVQTEAQAWLEASLGKTAFTAVSGPVVALLTAAGSSTSAGTEVTGGSYARTGITPGSATAATPSVIANTNVLTFAAMPAVTVTDIAVYNSSTRRLWFGPLGAPKTLGSGDTLSFAASAIQISLQ